MNSDANNSASVNEDLPVQPRVRGISSSSQAKVPRVSKTKPPASNSQEATNAVSGRGLPPAGLAADKVGQAPAAPEAEPTLKAANTATAKTEHDNNKAKEEKGSNTGFQTTHSERSINQIVESQTVIDRRVKRMADIERERASFLAAKIDWANKFGKINTMQLADPASAKLVAELLKPKKNPAEMSSAEAQILDNAMSFDPVVRRHAMQKRTTDRQMVGAVQQWAETFSHEVRERRKIDVLPEYVEGNPQRTSERAWRISLTPDALRPIVESPSQTASRLDRHRISTSNKETEVSHIILSLPNNGQTPTMGEMVALCRRMGSRIGVDWDQQESAAFVHCDTDNWHAHLLVGRTRSDRGRWSPGIGIDRALALEAKLMANEHDQKWDQWMVARSRHSAGAAALARRGELHAKIVYPDGEVDMVPWQGEIADTRIEMDWIAHAPHPGLSIDKQVGLRSADQVVPYCAG